MLQRLLLSFTLFLPVFVKAHDIPVSDTARLRNSPVWEELQQSVRPVYLKDAVRVSSWRGNWFISVSGGASAFIGSPLGCADLFGRMKPVLSVSAGKWFTPSVGARVAFQGFQFKDASLSGQGFRHLHADLMWNVLSYARRSEDDSRWDLIPYVGLGILHNEENGKRPFALSYGLQGRYRLNDRFHLTAELGSVGTFKDFDGMGASDKWGDRMLSLTAGISVTLGKTGWKRVIDAAPYMERNKKLADYARILWSRNGQLRQDSRKNLRVIAELEKILKLEGLLDKYAGKLSSMKESMNGSSFHGYPKNDYSGLNSLRARLRQAKNGTDKILTDTVCLSDKDTLIHPADDKETGEGILTGNDSVNSVVTSQKQYVGPPVYFFFRLNTDELTDASQMLNLDGIARIVRKYGLHVRITGAADSATGNDSINTGLSQKRAAYIAGRLLERGVAANRIETRSSGGIDDYNPTEANRNACVRLLFPLKESED